jgi:hypothetical protein
MYCRSMVYQCFGDAVQSYDCIPQQYVISTVLYTTTGLCVINTNTGANSVNAALAELTGPRYEIPAYTYIFDKFYKLIAPSGRDFGWAAGWQFEW